jgi:GPI mannosyltransferase 3
VREPSAAGTLPILRALDAIDERRLLWTMLAAGLALTLAAATTSDSVFQVDEHFQVVEAAGYKLGVTPAEALAWEFPARIRPWLQPGALALLARGLRAVGVESPFAAVRAFRVASGVAAWAAIALLLVAVRNWFPSARWRRAAILSLTLPYFVPYLAARTSSESVATTFLLLGLAAIAGSPTGEAGGSRAIAMRHLAAGVALGLAFGARYQVGLSVAGIVLWLLVHDADRRRKVLPLSAGLLLAVALGAAVDAWGYGTWELVPWNYLRVNLLEGRAATFGTSPWHGYLWMAAGVWPPFGLVLTVGLLLSWFLAPRHLLTWATVPFVVVHSLIGHKEIRFLFPMLPLATLAVLLAWSGPAPGRRWEARTLRVLSVVWFGRATWALNALGLAVLCLLPSTDNLELQRFFHDHAREPARWVALDDPRRFHGAPVPFLWPRPMPPVEVVRDAASLETALATGPGPTYVTAKYPLPAGAEEVLARRGTRVFSSLPAWLSRLDAFGWLRRADMTYVWRVDR